MKPAKKRRAGGNTAPQRRQAFPEVNQQVLDDKMGAYCRSMGIQPAFHLYQYQNLQVQQAENPRALCKLMPLLRALLQVFPSAKVKYRPLKQSLQVQQQVFGSELFSCHWGNENKSQLPGMAADAVGVVLNHWRRVSGTAGSWARFISRDGRPQEDDGGKGRPRDGQRKEAGGQEAAQGPHF
eukprot:Skav214674  [mRNA]  locus=scaffold923:523519:524064:+ [translate_table: standard]